MHTPDVARLQFRWPWRDYQARVLEAMPAYLQDDRLHVVAAPGSGKTVLGLEVFRRLGKPALVLSPTRTIRDQWLERLQDFLPEQVDVGSLEWISRDLARPAFLTSLTYQALHTRLRTAIATAAELGEASAEVEECEAQELEDEVCGAGPDSEELREVIASLQAANIGVLILDEAHHLRSGWWDALRTIVEAIPGLVLVSLTATPPYDVSGHEWARYVQLCGPIDEEISVPELVKAGTLCPHQDYVWLVRCEGNEAVQLQRHFQLVSQLLHRLQADQALLTGAATHAFVREPHAHINAILDQPAQVMALCAVLQHAGHAPAELMALADLQGEDLPPLNAATWEHFLRLYLFGAGWPEDDASVLEHRQGLARLLREQKLLWRRELGLAAPGRQWPRLGMSVEKAQACVQVHQAEYRARGDQLCQVILTDYIRDDDYAAPHQSMLTLGAWPVFYQLVSGASACRVSALALHTGRLSIIHRQLLPHLAQLMPEADVQITDVPSLPDFVQIQARGSHGLTQVLTALLQAGHVQVLVGTRALLGEGWDAPRVNSLILASDVGAFMTTNQMRGRAIRVDQQRPDKVASIWHLAAFSELSRHQYDARDVLELRRRFDTFVGLAHKAADIESGLARLRSGLTEQEQWGTTLLMWATSNNRMVRRLQDRDGLAKRWHEAVDHSDILQQRITPSVVVSTPPDFSVLHFRGTWKALRQAVFAVALFFVTLVMTVLWDLFFATGQQVAGWVYMLAGAATALFVFYHSLQVLRLYLRYLPVDGALRGIARAVRDALVETGQLPTAHASSQIIISPDRDAGYRIALASGSLAERELFADCMYQVLSPIDRPRYLISREHRREFGTQVDYHAVPDALGSRNERAQVFLQAWQKHVSAAELIHARGEDGRKALLQARVRAFSAATQRYLPACQRRDRWA